eukprot:366001-Chlamydomonas_euryale.AAC.3
MPVVTSVVKDQQQRAMSMRVVSENTIFLALDAWVNGPMGERSSLEQLAHLASAVRTNNLTQGFLLSAVWPCEWFRDAMSWMPSQVHHSNVTPQGSSSKLGHQSGARTSHPHIRPRGSAPTDSNTAAHVCVNHSMECMLARYLAGKTGMSDQIADCLPDQRVSCMER